MSFRKIQCVILVMVFAMLSCSNDDDNSGTVTPPRDRGEQQVDDDNAIKDYFEDHYYNASDFEGVTTAKIKDLVLSDAPADGRIRLLDDLNDPNGKLKEYTVTFADTEYKYYVLKLNQGDGAASPKFCDTARTLYEGSLLDGTVFDSAVTPVDLDLTTTIVGWQLVFPGFNAASGFIDNGDGTIDYAAHGAGVMFLPSGLGYFSVSQGSIPAYSPLIFKIELLQSFINDHDQDGVPSFLEDIFKLDGTPGSDGIFNLNTTDLSDPTDDDTDGDGVLDFQDIDDDNDGIATINEDLEDTDLTVDSDGDGDPTNDKNGDGDPTNDDTDGDGIPNYLDPDDSISKD